MITFTDVLLSGIFIVVAIIISSLERLRLERDTIEAAVRAFIQLMLIGYVLKFVFAANKPIFTTLMIILMVFAGSLEATRRAKGIRKPLPPIFVSMLVATIFVIIITVGMGIISANPVYLIPVSGIAVGNIMNTMIVSAMRFKQGIKENRNKIEAALALGMSPKAATANLRKQALRLALAPRLDRVKVSGIIHLPGAMTGMILAGASPIKAVKFQIIIMYIIICAPFVAAWILSSFIYKKFFNKAEQLVIN